METDLRQITSIVTGRVQGVGYRASVKKKAVELGLAGWVSNQLDGSVHCLVQGPADRVDRFISFLAKGPILARVKTVKTEEQLSFEKLVDFRVLK
ncbi:UNVERIFIED_CONTAM: hypothetical protein GTU68_033735 [Idotea baltica]|nr:hypothetical protein [Idotea baltica]